MTTALVLGLGPSLVAAHDLLPRFDLTLGVNDIEAHGIRPQHLVVLDRPDDFPADRLATILQSQPQHFWHATGEWEQLRPERPLAQVTRHRIRLNRTQPPPVATADPDELCFCKCSPYAAVHLAYRLGARRIAMLGVDLVNHRFLRHHFDEINEGFGNLHVALSEQGVELVNLSSRSGLTTVPKAAA